MRLEQFLFCEMARNEANGQLSLIGLYPGDIVRVQQQPQPIPTAISILPNLHCVVILGDMERVTALKFQMQVKHGRDEVLAVAPETIQRPTPRTPFQSLLFGFSPFPCTQGAGDYEFRITVKSDDAAPTTFSKRFTIEYLTSTSQARH